MMKVHTTPHRKPFQAGVTLLELLISIVILSGAVVVLYRLIDTSVQDTKSSVTALHVRTVGDAAMSYIKDNYGAITGVATASQPVLLRVADMVTTGHLTHGASAVNPRRQSTCVLILQPRANQLLALVVTEGGDTIDDITLGQIAATIGGAGGGIYSSAPTVMRGAMGGWEMAFGAFANPNHLGQRCDGSAGAVQFSAGRPVMALWFADGAAASATLHRDAVPGNPSLNTMNTPILMGAGTIQSEGGSCATNGALGRNAAGAVLACESGQWRKGGSAFWQDPVASFAQLPACNAASLGHTRVVRTPTIGSGARAYSCNGAGTWQALGINDTGNIDIPGTATISQATINRIGGNLEVTTVATQGSACAPNGRIARDANGLLLSCQSGSWQMAQGGGGVGAYTASGTVGGGASAWRLNPNMTAQIVTAFNPGGGFCSIHGEVSGVGIVIRSEHNDHWFKWCSVTFVVPPLASWRLHSSTTTTWFAYTF